MLVMALEGGDLGGPMKMACDGDDWWCLRPARRHLGPAVMATSSGIVAW